MLNGRGDIGAFSHSMARSVSNFKPFSHVNLKFFIGVFIDKSMAALGIGRVYRQVYGFIR